MANDNLKRRVAYKIRIAEILSYSYVASGDNNTNYLVLKDTRISRVNVLAVVLSADYDHVSGNFNAVIDDGTGNVSVRSFDKSNKFNAGVGDVVLVIGRVREYGSERYILPEIIKKTEDAGWIEVRKLELTRTQPNATKNAIHEEQEIVLDEDAVLESSSQVVYDTIKKFDAGDGADFDVVLANVNVADAEGTISHLLKEGEVFELRPGKLKVLE